MPQEWVDDELKGAEALAYRLDLDVYGTIYIDYIQKAVVICLIIPTIFPFDAISSISKYPDV
jgi:hypothetical protein